MEVIIVLGSPNFQDGTLGPIAIDRLNGCLSLFDPQKHKILCTGGFGAHFNTSPMAHAAYLKKYLIDHGVPDNNFLPMALSANTVEDAVKSKSILTDFAANNLIIITSKYHLARVKFIFEEILKGFKLDYKSIDHQGMDELLEPLIQHEKRALDQLLTQGLYY